LHDDTDIWHDDSIHVYLINLSFHGSSFRGDIGTDSIYDILKDFFSLILLGDVQRLIAYYRIKLGEQVGNFSRQGER